MPQNEADFENRLEQALAAYADPEDAGLPRLLTARVMTAVEAGRRQRRWWFFAAALPIAACLIMVVLLQFSKRVIHQQNVTSPLAVATVRSVPSPTTPSQRPVLFKKVHKRGPTEKARQSTPKLARFPSPSPLSKQERLLLAFATTVPPKEQEMIFNSWRRIDEPIHVSQLTIAPIDIQSISSEQ